VTNSGDIHVLTQSGIDGRAYGNASGDRAKAGIAIINDGDIDSGSASNASNTYGIRAETAGTAYAAGSDVGIVIENEGDIDAVTGAAYQSFGIFATTTGGAAGLSANAGIDIDNKGDLKAGNFGIYAGTVGYAVAEGSNAGIAIDNEGDVDSGFDGIAARTFGSAIGADSNASAAVTNSGDIDAENIGIAASSVGGLFGASGADSTIGITVENSGDIDAGAAGIHARSVGSASGNRANAGIAIDNAGDIGAGDFGIYAITFGVAAGEDANTAIDVANTGAVAANIGIYAQTLGNADGLRSNVGIAIANYGAFDAGDFGIRGETTGDATGNYGNVGIAIRNRGDIEAATGILARTSGSASGTGSNAGIVIDNDADIVSNGTVNAGALYTSTTGNASGENSNAGITIDNDGDLVAERGGIVAGTFGAASGAGSSTAVRISNDGDVSALQGIYTVTQGTASGMGSNAGIAIDNGGAVYGSIRGISARTYGMATGVGSSTDVAIDNGGAVTGGAWGILAGANYGSTTIVNSGYVSAANLRAIQVVAGPAAIYNSGTIVGYVLLDADDLFVNEAGGTFEARLTSDFGELAPDNDLFVNEAGARVHTAANNAVNEFTAFIGLERFENAGTISLVDGREGDVFQIADSLGTDIAFVASGGSKLAVDAFLGGPGSTADNFIVAGDVSGSTGVTVNNTNPGAGAYNPVGIPVVLVTGDVSANQFFLKNGPIETGLFTYDLFFEPGAVDQFELRSFPGGGAHVLPQLLTASQDIWYATSETWLDRTADLRVQLYGAPGPANLKDGAVVPAGNITPGLWVRGSGTWLDRDDQASTSAYGRTYKYNLDRDLNLGTVQGGVDFGSRGVLAEGDALLYGLLGGAVFGELTYDQLARQFDIDGGEVGGYLTYLSGGLYIDNLLKATFTEFDGSTNSGIPGLDSTVWGFRSDGGYRFGAPRQGAFFEPQATIAAAWTDMDNFTLAGNSVKFGDETDVRGRLGLRVGTSRLTSDGGVIEPFVVGSLWGDLSGDNKATVTSSGTSFGFTDKGDDVWGVVSGGLNLFAASGNASAFAKVDYTFGDDIDGFGAKLGMRANW
jgi:outer membrane autotransporter protein